MGKILRFPLKLIPRRTVVFVLSGIARGMRWELGTSRHECWLGTYEFQMQNALRSFIKPGMIIYDIGAQAGFYTLACSRMVGKNGHVYAFEPYAENVHSLLKHIKYNKLKNVTVIQAAVSDCTTLDYFQVGIENSTGKTVREPESSERHYLVSTHTIDALIEKNGLKSPDLIKIDVEGCESRVLKGGKITLRKMKPVLFISLHDLDQEKKCRSFLESLDYDIFLMNGMEVLKNTSSILINNRIDIYAVSANT